MSAHHVIAIGASAGGIEALLQIAAGLPADLPAAVLVAVHTPPRRRSGIAELLSKRGRLPAREPNDGEPVECSRMYVAPPDRHLTLAGDQIRVTAGPRENSVRPAIDPLFRTAAETYRRRVVGVILSGALDDGVAGLLRVKLRGGAAVVQDPEDALFPGMPTAALQHVKVDYVVPASQIAEVLTDLAHGRNYRQREREMGDDDRDGAQVVAQGQGAWENGSGGAQRATGITCPECGGVLWEVHSDPILQFRCHTSHVYSAESLLDEVCRQTERSLWEALRRLREQASYSRRLSEHAAEHGRQEASARFAKQAESAYAASDAVKDTIDSLDREDTDALQSSLDSQAS